MKIFYAVLELVPHPDQFLSVREPAEHKKALTCGKNGVYLVHWQMLKEWMFHEKEVFSC